MAKRAIVVDHGGEVSAFRFARVDRAKLYGRKERVVLDEQGQPCVSAYLTADGAALVPPGGTAHVYVDETYDTIERADLVAVDDDGQLLESVPSTLGVAQALTPVPPERILDHRIVSVYELTAAPGEDEEAEPAVGATLRAALESGTLFETTYAYRDGYEADALFLLHHDGGIFALVGRPTGFEMLTREPPAAAAGEEDDVDELDDDLDFSML